MVEVEKSEIHHNIINEDAKSRPRSDDDEREDLEEGEIAPADEDTAKTPAAVLHPLENSWTFWFHSQSAKNKAKAKAKQEAKQDSWGTYNPIHTFSEIEVFWSLYNNIHHPSSLTHGADLYCFKHQIEPMWEDPICANGGKWTTIFQKGKSDTAWLYTLLAMIGEQFDYGDEICGAVVNVRSTQEKISIWTKNADNKEAQMSIGKQWKQFLDYSDIIGFIYHEDAKKQDRAAKSRYTA